MSDTRSALLDRLQGTSRRKLAAELGCNHWDITDGLNGRLGHDRENRIRAALSLPPLPQTMTVEIDPTRQRVVPRSKPRRRRFWNVLIV